MSTLRTIAVRLLLIGLLFIGYWTAWRPMRGVVLNEVAVPILQWSASSETAVQARGGPVRITLPGGAQASLPAPAGIPFLLPALFLVAVFPKHGYWLFFWAGHCLLFAGMVAAWSAALMAWPGALGVADFLQTYGVDLYSLGVPVALWVRHRQRT